MNYTKISVKGIDTHIQKMQTYLYTELKSAWSVSDAEFDMFGRAYRNQTKDLYFPEIYVSNGEYKELYWDDTKKAMAFWAVKSSRSVNKTLVEAEIFLIFMLNLSKLKGTVERKDEETRMDVEKLCLYSYNGLNLIGFETENERVFADYSGWKKNKFHDTHPYHCFRLNFKIYYPIYN
jgi:hypothetical protein